MSDLAAVNGWWAAVTGRDAPGEAGRVPIAFEESDLSIDLEGDETQCASSRFLDRLIHEPCPRRRTEIVQAAISRLGFDWMTYVTMVDRAGTATPAAYLVTYAHQRWAADYFHRGLWVDDVRLALAGRSPSPLVWSLDTLLETMRHHPGSHDECLTTIQRMEEHGIRSGVFIALPIADSRAYAVVSLSSPRASRRWITDEGLGQAMILATGVHEMVSHAMPHGHQDLPSTQLSETQRRVLECLCLGMGDKSIAAALSMSTHNVDYHLRALRRRFGLRNRVQLAQWAAAQGVAKS